jgi:hypothetical protein
LSGRNHQTAGENLGLKCGLCISTRPGTQGMVFAESCIVAAHPRQTGTHRFRFRGYPNLSLGELVLASASSFSRGAEAEHMSRTTEVKCLSGSYVNCVELVFRPAGQFVQVESRVPESRNRNPPERRTIGEFLKKVILTNHRSLRDVRLLGNANSRRGWLDCQIHRFNLEDRILRHLCMSGPAEMLWAVLRASPP